MAYSEEVVYETPGLYLYAGSRLLQPISDSTGVPIDQVNYITCMFTSLVWAIWFRLALANATITVRHSVEIFLGVGLLYFFCGHKIMYLVFQATTAYAIMRFAPQHCQHFITFIFCFGYLSAAHLARQIYDYGGYTLDVDAPLMVVTQRLTALAFSVHDGANVETLAEEHKFLAVTRFPSLLEFFSYSFTFHSPLTNFFHYADYIAFVEGNNWTRFQNNSGSKQNNDKVSGAKDNYAIVRVENDSLPLTRDQLLHSSMKLGTKVVLLSIFSLVLTVTVTPYFPVENLKDPSWYEQTSFWHKSWFIVVLAFFYRHRYYTAFGLSHAANIYSGLAFSGVSSSGQPLWQLTDNIDVAEFELGTRFAGIINAWNKTTSSWLRFLVYDRATWHPTLLTFFVSALWHGLYPGYYITFLTISLFLQAVRVIRSTIMPVFRLRTPTRMLYNATAFLLIRFTIVYACLPFLLLTSKDSIRLFSGVYFWPHILAVVVIILLPQVRKMLPASLRTNHRVYGKSRAIKEVEQNGIKTD